VLKHEISGNILTTLKKVSRLRRSGGGKLGATREKGGISRVGDFWGGMMGKKEVPHGNARPEKWREGNLARGREETGSKGENRVFPTGRQKTQRSCPGSNS